MKKSLLALAALTAFAGAASAQSSVTLFGILDAGIARLSAGGKSVTGMENSGYNSSRLGFRGTEDLGGGLKANFWLEGQLFNDTGDGSATGAAMNWQRQTWVGLSGGFGELRLGRDYTGNFVNVSAYDAFGTNGVGTSMGFGMVGAAGNGIAAVRASNSISYTTPAMGGFSLKVMCSFGEGVDSSSCFSGGANSTNNHWNIRAGYAAGPVSAHVAYAKTEGATDAADVKYFSVGASFNAGVVVPMLVVAQEKTGAGLKIQAIIPAAHINVGNGTIRLSYGRYDIKDSSNDWNKMAAGYVHNVSKRTALYGTYARVSNKGTQNKTVGTNGVGGVAASAGGNSSGFEFGVRHSF